jgi:phospholipase/carboxylesterase
MADELQSARRGPPNADAAVIFVHGYGADGADLLGLSEPLAPHLPGTSFYAPDAPEPSTVNPMGRQWFPIPWLDGSTQAAAETSMARSVAVLDAFVDRVLADEGIEPDRLILFGFSQGTMMSLHVAPRRREPLAGVVGFSGRLLGGDRLAAETVSRPPVLLIHGDADEVVPPESLPEAAEALEAADFDVSVYVMRGTGHGISPEGLGVAVGWMRERLGKG